VAIVQFALRDKTRLGALRIRDDVLMLQALLWADEVREAGFPALETSVRISAQEREMSAALVESMASDFEPEQFTDDYQAQLRQLIEAKLEKGDSLDTEETFGVAAESGTGEVIDLMEALKRSLEKKRGGAGGEASDVPAKPAARTAGRSGARSGAATDAAKEAGAAKAPAKTATRSASKPAGAAAKTSAAKSGTAAKAGSGTKSTAASKTAAKPTAAKTARKGA